MKSQTIPLTHTQTRQIAVRHGGTGPAFVWGHTLLGCMAQEDDTGLFGWEALSQVSRVIRYDALGHGESAAAHDPLDHSWEQRASDMWGVADTFAAGEEVILGGASMGCATALHAACTDPARVRGLVLAIPPTAGEERRAQVASYLQLSRYLTWFGATPFKCLQAFARVDWRKRTEIRRKLERSTALHFRTDDPRSIVAALQGAALSDLPDAAALVKLQVPTLILAWPDDAIHPLSTAQWLASLLPNATLSVASEPDQALDWTGQISDFLRGLDVRHAA